MTPTPPIFNPAPYRFSRVNAIWLTISLALLCGLAALPPHLERHKQFMLLAIALIELLETRIIVRFPKRGLPYVLLLKTLLAALVMDHTGKVNMYSNYYPIYYLPVVTAALYFGVWATMLWTLFVSVVYCSYLYPAIEYEATLGDLRYLGLRILSFFLVAVIVQRFSRFEHSPKITSGSAT